MIEGLTQLINDAKKKNELITNDIQVNISEINVSSPPLKSLINKLNELGQKKRPDVELINSLKSSIQIALDSSKTTKRGTGTTGGCNSEHTGFATTDKQKMMAQMKLQNLCRPCLKVLVN